MSAARRILRDLAGEWSMSKARSSDVTPVLALQGFNILTRTAAAAAPIALHIVQESDSEIHIKQSTTASIPAVNEEWYLDWQEREQKDAFLGKVKSKSRWNKVSQVQGEPFLTEGLGSEDEIIEAEVESLEYGCNWKARQLWFVEDASFIRRVVTTKGNEKVQVTLVYEPK